MDYACRAMVHLALRVDAHTPTRLEEIAQREDVSANFLVQILNDLKRGGLIVSRRGKGGGYLLARVPESISLAEIIQAVEPGMLVLPDAGGGESGPAVRQTWKRVSGVLQGCVESITLRQLADHKEAPMYHI